MSYDNILGKKGLIMVIFGFVVLQFGDVQPSYAPPDLRGPLLNDNRISIGRRMASHLKLFIPYLLGPERNSRDAGEFSGRPSSAVSNVRTHFDEELCQLRAKPRAALRPIITREIKISLARSRRRRAS